jgi:hypothetical protein
MDPDQHVHMRRDHPDLEDPAAFLPGDAAEEAA